MQRGDHKQRFLCLLCIQLDSGCSSEKDRHRRIRCQKKSFRGQEMGIVDDDTWFRSPESWIWFVPWIILHWLADRPRESLPEGQHPSQEPAESASWTSSWTVSRSTCKERPINGNLSREERQRVPVQFGSGREQVMIKEVILKGGLTLECKVYDFLNGGLVSQTVAILQCAAGTAYGQVAFWTYHTRAQKQSQRQQNKSEAAQEGDWRSAWDAVTIPGGRTFTS